MLHYQSTEDQTTTARERERGREGGREGESQQHTASKERVTPAPTHLTMPENSNRSARIYERYPIVNTMIGSSTAHNTTTNARMNTQLAALVQQTLTPRGILESQDPTAKGNNDLTMHMLRKACDESSHHASEHAYQHTGRHHHYKLSYGQQSLWGERVSRTATGGHTCKAHILCLDGGVGARVVKRSVSKGPQHLEQHDSDSICTRAAAQCKPLPPSLPGGRGLPLRRDSPNTRIWSSFSTWISSNTAST